MPVIFPQFAGQGPLPKHGFARNLGWELVSARSESPYQADARLALHVSKRTLSIWPRRFELELAVHLRPGSLEITLRVQNTDRQPWDFTGALHSYFRVSDVRKTRIAGLGGVEYIESTNDRIQKRQSEPEIIFGSEVDRIYMNAPGQVDIFDSPRRIFVTSENFPDWVIWNPGPIKGQALSDLEPDGYLRFVCAEAAAASRPVTLQPGEHWQGSTRFSLSPAPAP